MSVCHSYLVLKYLQEKRDQMDDDRRKRSRRLRILRDRFSKHSIPDKEFEFKYRLNKGLFDQLLAELTPLLAVDYCVLDNGMKILLALNFFAWGRYQGSVAHKFNIPYKTVLYCIEEVTLALNHQSIREKYIKFPKTKEERDYIKKNFELQYGIPDVIGCIASTYIPIIKPSQNAEGYMNEYGYYSFIAQVICDSSENILHMDATYGGAAQDCIINLSIAKHLNELQETAYILGHSMYLQEKYLMIPIYVDENEEKDTPESRYNEIHQKAYSAISIMFSQLKARWRCLLSWKELHYDHVMAAKIFYACCVLHNLCNTVGMDAPLLSEYELEEDRKRQYEPSLFLDFDDGPVGEVARKRLIQLLEEKRLAKIKVLETKIKETPED